MACPTCGKPIAWVPNSKGVRVAVGAHQNPVGNWYVDKTGVLRPYHSKVGDVPRYDRHVPCPEATSD